MTVQPVWIRLSSTLLVGASFAFLLTGITWYGFILHANDRNTETLKAIEAEVVGVVKSNREVIDDNQRMLKEIQESMLDRTRRLDEIRELLKPSSGPAAKE